MLQCFFNKKCSWCKKYKEDAKEIKVFCKYYQMNLCKSCYKKHFLEKAKIPFEERSDIFF